jgi:hypothetical protein
MSEYIRLYQERQAKRWRLKKIKKKASPEEYWALKDEIDALGVKLDEIIRNDTRIQAAVSVGNQG